VDLWRLVIARQSWRLRSARLRKKAEEARVKGRLRLAQALYRRYLRLRPDDPISWYMLGQVYRDRHRPTLAEPCYHHALTLAPDYWRVHAALGRFLRSTGRAREAHAAFTRAVALGANEQTRRALLDLSAPGLRPDADAAPGAATIWIDIADLLIFLRDNRHPSGIQRVQLELLRQAISRPGQAAIITTMPWDRRIWCLSPGRIAAMLQLLDSKGGGTAAIREVIKDVLETAAEAEPQSGLVLFQPGAFWIGGGNPPLHHRVRAAGMKVVPLIHDLIPVRMTDQFDAELEWSPTLRKRVRIMSDLSDAEIETLYTQCLFTAFPSLAEGWGLPVGESLARGRVCVCSNRDSMPEVGGAAAITIDPLDVPAATAVFRRLLFTPGALREAEETLRENFRPRGWPEVTAAIFTALAGLVGQPGGELAAPLLRPGIRYRPSSRFEDDWPEPFAFQPRLMLAEGWWKPGPEGAFMAGDRAMLHLAVPEDGELGLRFVAREPAEVSAGGVTLSLTLAQPGGMLIVPVKAGRLRLELRARTGLGPEVPPGVWLTAVELRRVSL